MLKLKRTLAILAVPLLALLVASPTAAAPEAPTHNETALTLFSCAATRNGTGHGTMTINHSHKIAAESTTEPITGNPAIDAIDCEGYVHAGLDGCVWRVDYIYGNKLDGTDLGIVGPVNITCFGF